MAKRYLDKYYTPRSIVKKILEIIEKDIMPLDKFKRIIEPSAGNGAFLKELNHKNILAFDIAPEYESIIQGDYLNQNLEVLKHSLVIGNPPFGISGVLAKKFIKKSFTHSDYVVFILPGDNYQNRSSIPGIKLFKSYLLPKVKYSGVLLSCCLNIYVKGVEKRKKINGVKLTFHEKSKDINENNEYLLKNYDYRIITFGTLRFLEKNEVIKIKEMKINFDKKVNFKPILENFFKLKNKRAISATNANIQDIIDLIYDNYPELRAN